MKDRVEEGTEVDVTEKGKFGGMLLAATGFRSKRLKGQLVWRPLGRRCRKMWKEGKFYFLYSVED